jgi:hypothetical protein
MGTTWHAKYPGQPDDEPGLHIGKFSGGWEFLFRAHTELGLTSSTAWRRFLDHPWVTIVAETGVEVTASEFWEDVARRSGHRQHEEDAQAQLGDRMWRDSAGHVFFNVEFC